jgi:hypothetical protein
MPSNLGLRGTPLQPAEGEMQKPGGEMVPNGTNWIPVGKWIPAFAGVTGLAPTRPARPVTSA